MFLVALLAVTNFTVPSVSEAAPPVQKQETLWDAWYTITLKQTVKYAYFHEVVRRDQGRIHYQSDMWKKEDDFINEEHLGSFAEDKPELAPLFFNLESFFRGSKTKIDGTVRDGNLTVKTTRGEMTLPMNTISISSKSPLFFSVFFPLWVKNSQGSFKKGKVHGFWAILEDNIDEKFKPKRGLLRLEDEDALSKSTKTTKYTVRYGNITSTWYIHPSGMTEKMVNSKQKSVLQRVTESAAKDFFK